MLVQVLEQRFAVFLLNNANVLDIRTIDEMVALARLQVSASSPIHCDVEQVASGVNASILLAELSINVQLYFITHFEASFLKAADMADRFANLLQIGHQKLAISAFDHTSVGRLATALRVEDSFIEDEIAFALVDQSRLQLKQICVTEENFFSHMVTFGR